MLELEDVGALRRDVEGVVTECRPADPAIDRAIDGVSPALVCRPASVDEVAGALAVANRHGAGVVPRGGGTKLGLGAPPRRADLLLALDQIHAIGEYSPADLTISCQAGVRWRDLQAYVGAHQQFVPIDPPFASDATVGGVLATNSYGPSRIGYGAPRDYLIGVKVANPDGALTKAGGKVVKNVAGYDLNKLYIGSLGTVGVIVEATWKLLPMPATSETLLIGLPDVRAASQIALRTIRAGLQPRCLQVFDAASFRRAVGADPSRPSGSWLAVRFSGRTERVRRQIADSEQVARTESPTWLDQLAGPAESAFWDRVANWAALVRPDYQAPARCKVAVLPTDLPAVWGVMAEADPALRLEVCGQAGTGILHACLETAGPIDRAAQTLAAWRSRAAAGGGSLVIEEAPLLLKQRIDAWGDPGEGLPIMRRLKDLLDPNGILNPGRFVAGI